MIIYRYIYFIIIIYKLFYKIKYRGAVKFGDWGLGIGDWGLGDRRASCRERV